MNRLCLLVGHTAIYLIFNLVPLLAQSIQFSIHMVSSLQELLDLDYFWTDVARFALKTFYLLVQLFLHAFTFDIFWTAVARIR